MPGAEKVSDAEVAKRKAVEPLKPKVGQKPADEGLFGDEANQTDFVDLAGCCAIKSRLPSWASATSAAECAIRPVGLGRGPCPGLIPRLRPHTLSRRRPKRGPGSSPYRALSLSLSPTAG